MPERDTLVLLEHGEGGCVPDQDPWEPIAGRLVAIVNESGEPQDITNITNHCLKTKNGKTKKKIKDLKDGKRWVGYAGAKGTNGLYTYEDGESEAAPRNGHIDPS